VGIRLPWARNVSQLISKDFFKSDSIDFNIFFVSSSSPPFWSIFAIMRRAEDLFDSSAAKETAFADASEKSTRVRIVVI
jgi:hypothetical protein